MSTSTSPYAFVACCLINHKDVCTLDVWIIDQRFVDFDNKFTFNWVYLTVYV